jgi:hypothetical protein
MPDLIDHIRIRCAICDRPVSSITIWREPEGSRVKIVAKCHGDSDEMVLTDNFLASLDRNEAIALAASEGVAFATRRIGDA